MGEAPGGTNEPRAGRVALLAMASLLVALTMSVSPGQGQEPGVTVINVPPEFSAIHIGSDGSLHRVDVVVSDYNSWRDIYRVEVEVLDDAGEQVAHVLFQQYASNETQERDEAFLEPRGQILVPHLSGVTYNPDPQTIAERSEMRITFVLNPIKGRWLRVTASDLTGLMATAQVEYLTGAIGGPSALPPVVLLLLSAAASVIVVGARVRRERYGA